MEENAYTEIDNETQPLRPACGQLCYGENVSYLILDEYGTNSRAQETISIAHHIIEKTTCFLPDFLTVCTYYSSDVVAIPVPGTVRMLDNLLRVR